MKRNYDLVAGVYDKLAKLFIGDALHRSQVYFLRCIPKNANILLVGGGTGRILEEISVANLPGLRIDYVDASRKMIAIAKSRDTGDNKVNFIHQQVIEFVSDIPYDVIITPFLLDNFSEPTLQKVFNHLHQKLKPEGIWLYTDFQVKNKRAYLQQSVLFVMYSFFRIVCNIEAKKLPDIVSRFNYYGYQLINSKTFLNRFIVTSVYKRQSEE